MDSKDGIEKLIMMEMEREIRISRPAHIDVANLTTTLPPPIKLSPMDSRLLQEEGDAIRVEMEKQMRMRVEQGRSEHPPLPLPIPASHSSCSNHGSDAFGGGGGGDDDDDDDDNHNGDGDVVVVHVARPERVTGGSTPQDSCPKMHTLQRTDALSNNGNGVLTKDVINMKFPVHNEFSWRETLSDGNISSCKGLGCGSDENAPPDGKIAVLHLLTENSTASNEGRPGNRKDDHDDHHHENAESACSSTGERDTASEGSPISSFLSADIQNHNGILCETVEDVPAAFPDEDPPHETFEMHAARELSHLGSDESGLRSHCVEWHVYETMRESGRCLYPPGEERNGDLSALSVQLGFFRSKQVIISSAIHVQRLVAVRERHAGPDQRSLSTLHCFFEHELLQDPSVTLDDEDLPHNSAAECLITERELTMLPVKALVNRALSKLTFGDPIQVWERARNRSFDLLHSSSRGNAERPTTCTVGPTTNCIWVNQVETIKPVPAVGVFTGGTPFRVECTKIGGPMIEIHGKSVDPLVVSMFFCSLTPSSNVKISETFSFDLAVDIFYPQKGRMNVNRENHAVVFIPREFLASLYLVVRVYRLASEDYDNYVDLYTRPDRYKSHHISAMKEDMQLLATTSDVMEELGWNVIRCSQEHDAAVRSIEVKKLYRKSLNDAELFRLVNDERGRGTLRTVPMELEFTLLDCGKHEVTFPSQFTEPRPEENERMVSLLNPDIPGARPETSRYVPCAIPILNSGFFHSYHSVYYFRLHSFKVAISGNLRKLPSTHRTYVMQICVKDQDVSLAEEGLPLLYGSRLSGPILETSLWTSTVHNCTEFDLSDEFKVQLPLYLTDAHHIFITLYASHQKKNSPLEGQQRLYKIGYAAFPITHNGVVQVKEDWGIKFVSADQAVVISAGGYLTKFPEAPPSALLNNGNPVLRASTQTRTSVYASNRIIAGILRDASAALKSIVQGDDVLSRSGCLSGETAGRDDEYPMKIVALMRQLPLAEILAFYPLLSSLNFALISSPSSTVSLACRTAALDLMIDISFKAQQYDVTTQALRRRQRHHEALSPVQTSVAVHLYHFLTNDVLYNGQRYRLYAGVAEAWLNLLTRTKGVSPARPPAVGVAPESSAASPVAASPTNRARRNIKKEMADVSWFLFGVILRSAYIWALENPRKSRTQLFDPSFYTLVGKLCTKVLDTLDSYANSGVMAQQVALFVRNMCNHCDRGQMLNVYQHIVNFFVEREDMDGLNIFLKVILEDADAVVLMLPSASCTSPVYLTRILVDSFSKLLVDRDRDKRAAATATLYEFLCRLSNNTTMPAVGLKWVASQLFALLCKVSYEWKTYLHLCDTTDSVIAVEDKRQLAVAMLWIVYYSPRRVIRDWLLKNADDKSLSGLMGILTDAQSFLRYNAGVDKADPRGIKNPTTELREWDARMSTFATAIGSQMCSIFLEDIPHVLQTVRRDSGASVVVLPFFVLLESLLHLGGSTVALQIGSCTLFEVVRSLFPAIISGTTRMSAGLVLLVFRLMSSCSMHVRSIAAQTFFLMCRSYFAWNHSLARMKTLTANALVSVAESKARNLRLVGHFIEFQLDDLLERARRADEEPFVPPSPMHGAHRQTKLSGTGGGASALNQQHHVDPLFLSVERRIPISNYLLDGAKGTTHHVDRGEGRNGVAVGEEGSDKDAPRFSEEFATLSQSALSLFYDVLRLQMDGSMRFKEAKVFAYFEVVRNFLRQNALREALKWLHRLHELHKTNGNMPEAGMVLFFIAALCFRITEVFYHIKRRDSSGGFMPFGLLSHVFWHDYVRVLPEVDVLFPADTVHAIVSELHVCPDEICFTAEGQVKVLKEAAEHLDKEHYYVFSVSTTVITDKYLRAINDFKGAAAVHTAMATWCTAIAQKVRRYNHRYFLLWARMERAENPKMRLESQEGILLGERPHGLPGGRPIKRVYKMSPTTTLPEFKDYCTAYIASFFEDTSLVVLIDELTETLPALPEPTSKKKRVAALHQPLNHCWVTVCEVHACLETGKPMPADGFDKSMHIQKFQNIVHVGVNSSSPTTEVAGIISKDLMNLRMSINVYKLHRAFPSTTTAIDVMEANETLLDAFETAKVTLENRIEAIKQVPEDDALITVLREALSPMGITPPGTYMKNVIAAMGSHTEIVDMVKALSRLVREKLTVCEKRGAPAKRSNDYALVLKAVTDIECCLIAMVGETPPDDERDD